MLVVIDKSVTLIWPFHIIYMYLNVTLHLINIYDYVPIKDFKCCFIYWIDFMTDLPSGL